MVSCADSPFKEDVSEDVQEARQKALYKLQTWTLKARLAIQTEQDGWTVTFHWVQDDDLYTMRFITPFGKGTYELKGDRNGVSLLTAENQLLQADNPERLLLDNLGWKVPFDGLKYWVRGLPEPGIDPENLVRDNKGRITDLQQSGWRISILRYAEVKGIDLPGKIFMQNDRFKLRLVIQDWKTT